MSTDNFKWTDELVKEYVNSIMPPLEQLGRGIINGITGDKLEQFKQSKSPSTNLSDGKDWEIVSFKHIDYGIMFKDAQGHYQHVSNHGRGWCISLEEALKNSKNMSIFSVRRLSDNVVFTHLERDGDGNLITGFNVVDNKMRVELDYGSVYKNIIYLTEPTNVKPPTNPIPEKPEDGSWLKNFEKEFEKKWNKRQEEYFELMMNPPAPPDTPVKEKIEVAVTGTGMAGEHTFIRPMHEFQSIPQDKFPAIKQAIEAALNEDTVVCWTDDLVADFIFDNHWVDTPYPYINKFKQSKKFSEKTDTVVQDKDARIQELCSELRRKTQEQDTMMEDTWKAAREYYGYHAGLFDNFIYKSIEDYKNSLQPAPVQPQEKVSTNNDDVACLSLNDLIDAVSYKYSHKDCFKTTPMYKDFEQKLNQKLKQ